MVFEQDPHVFVQKHFLKKHFILSHTEQIQISLQHHSDPYHKTVNTASVILVYFLYHQCQHLFGHEIMFLVVANEIRVEFAFSKFSTRARESPEMLRLELVSHVHQSDFCFPVILHDGAYKGQTVCSVWFGL